MDIENKLGDSVPLLEEQCNPIFVVGMNGSGTSMLADCLGQHPELFATPWETKLFPYIMMNINKYGDLEIDDNFLKLWKAVLSIPVLPQINSWEPVYLPRNWQDFPRDLSSVIDAVFRSISLKQNKQRWAEKTPQYIQHLIGLSDLFPGAKFIHIIRDGRDCAASFNRRWKRTPEHTIYRWKCVLQEGHIQSAELGDRYFQLKFEDLTASPEEWLRKICDFVDLPFDKNVLRSNQPQKEGVDMTVGKIQPNSQKWKSYFNEEQIEKLEKIAGKSLHDNGYEVMYELGNKDPSFVLRFYWRWKDAFREFLDIGIKKISGKKKRTPWSRIFNFVMTSIKQSRTNKF